MKFLIVFAIVAIAFAAAFPADSPSSVAAVMSKLNMDSLRTDMSYVTTEHPTTESGTVRWDSLDDLFSKYGASAF